MGLPAILFRFLRNSIRETSIGSSSKKGKFIPNGRLTSDILVENGLMDYLPVSGLTSELVKDFGIFFWGKNLKSMGLIFRVVKPDYLPTKEDIYGMRILVANFPIFTQIDPPDVLDYYLSSCIEEGFNPLVDMFNLLETHPDAYGKRKKSSNKNLTQGEGTSEPPNKK